MTRRGRPALLATLLAILLGCGEAPSTPAATQCADVGVQCQLPEGPLGVCERAPCAAGETPPCFQCTPQH